MSNKKTKVNSAAELLKADKQLRQAGFEPCMPAHYGLNKDKSTPQSWGDMIRGQLTTTSGNTATALPNLAASTGNENKTGAEGVGTDGLGWMEWGVGNKIPNAIALLTSMLPYTAAGMKFNTDLCAGMGPQPMYRYSDYVGGSLVTKEVPFADAGVLLRGKLREATTETEHAELSSLLNKWEATQKELAPFMQNNNLGLTYLQLATDEQMLGLCFPEIQLQQRTIDENGKMESTQNWNPKAIGLSARPAHTCRLERMDSQNHINYVYISNRWWEDPRVISTMQDLQVAALPALNPQQPLKDLNSKIRKARTAKVSVNARPTRFILPSAYPTAGRPYYPTPAWHSIFNGDIYEYCFTMIEDRNTRKKNSSIIGRIIYIHHDYLMSLYNQQGADNKQSVEEIRDQMFHQINSWLKNRDNSGQSLIAFNFTGPDGKEHKSFEILEVESGSKTTADANQKELSEVSSIIFFAMGLDAKLVGNTPGDTSSSGGTDLRERYLVKQIQMAPTSQLLLKPLDVIRDFNQWDEHLVWRIRREVLTTLDNSKTGITNAEENG